MFTAASRSSSMYIQTLFPCAVVIIDPGINNAQGYKPYQDGIDQDIYIKVSAWQPIAKYSNCMCFHNVCN